MSISKSYNKNNGVTYVYEVYENYWDKETKKKVSKRRLIGKIDPVTGEIVPTRRKKSSAQPAASSLDTAPADPAAALSEQLKAIDSKAAVLSQISLLESLIKDGQNNLDCLMNTLNQYKAQLDILKTLVKQFNN